MKIYDISQEVFTCKVYPGDPAPQMHEDMRMSRGDLYNLTSFEMDAHNGTHMDAPFHFIKDGETIEQIPLEKMVGYCYVSVQNTDIDENDARSILEKAKQIDKIKQIDETKKMDFDCARRILIKGTGVVTAAAARVFAEESVFLVGVESQTVGPEEGPMEVHKILLNAKTVLLEGLCLQGVEEGIYLLNAAPISLKGSDGAPCRAILIEN